MSADFWAGYASGAVGIVIGNPLDLVKVRLQATPSAGVPHVLPTSSSSPAETQLSRPKATVYTFRDALRGLPAPVLTYGALNALLFTTYNRSLYLLSRPDSSSPLSSSSLGSYDLAASSPTTAAASYPYWAHFAAGTIAGLATFVISAPTELVKCRAQVLVDAQASSSASVRSISSGTSVAIANGGPRTSWQITKHTLRTEGIRGLYHGGVVTSLRDGLGYGAYFLTYEASKDLWATVAASSQNASSNGTEAAKILLCGGLAGIATWVSIFPLDVIKTRVQTLSFTRQQAQLQAEASPYAQPRIQHTAASSSSSEHSALLNQQNSQSNVAKSAPRLEPQSPAAATRATDGAWKVALHAYRTEGTSVFFRGLSVCCVRAFIVNAVQWAVYEWMMRGFLQQS